MQLSRVGDLRGVLGGPWPQVRDLSVLGYLGVDVIDAVAARFPSLHRLTLRVQGAVDLGDLARLPVEVLDLQGCRIVNLSGVTATSTLQKIWLEGCPDVDLRPLAGRKLELYLSRKSAYHGLDELGPGATVNWIGVVKD
ncbi:hypothetical protein [Kibdelosporangium aridum]|uniref:hypothetical protein n=1 Tax=Kibdelosporangium aridum TaxID=2030 RepID=UPI0005247072